MMKNNCTVKVLSFLVMFMAWQVVAIAQSPRKLVHSGNKLYEEKKYDQAEIDYRKAIEKNKDQFPANYNLGNTYYQEGKFEEATNQFQSAASAKSVSPEQAAKSYHNMGNAFMKDKKYEQAINSYKQALKANPQDNDTRYNLAYAQAMLQQQQQQQQNKDDKNKDKDKQDQKDQKDKQEKQQQEQQQQQDQQQKQQQQKEEQQEARKDKISKEDAEKILQALNNDEKKTQKKLNVKQPVKVRIEKEW